MKTKFLFLSMALSFITFSNAQSFSCADFTIVSTIPNPQNTEEILLGVQFSAAQDVFLNYPYVAAVLNCSGDTVATGSLNFFGQFGQTTENYTVTQSGDLTCAPLTAILVYMNNEGVVDTCSVAFESTLNLPQKEINSLAVKIFPNPASTIITLEKQISTELLNYEICTLNGQIVKKGKLIEMQEQIDISYLENGVYYIRFNNDLAPLKLVKQ